jgi:hypothetical protein
MNEHRRPGRSLGTGEANRPTPDDLPDQLRASRQMRAVGESVATICVTLGVKRATLYKAWSETPESGDVARSCAARCLTAIVMKSVVVTDPWAR